MISVCDRVYLVGGYELTRPDDCLIYLLDGGEELALIDAGAGRSVEAIWANVRALGFDPRKLNYVIATHGHIDHIGGLAELQRRGLRVVAHALDRPAIAENNPIRNAADLYGVRYRPVEPEIEMTGGEFQLPVGDVVLHLLHTPGHTPGSLVGYVDLDAGRVLFGQDIHGPFRRSWLSDLNQWRHSMQRLIALQADILCEGHYGVFEGRDSVRRFIQEQISNH